MNLPLPSIRRAMTPVFAGWMTAWPLAAAPAPQAPILVPPLAREELVSATLTSNLFARSRDDLADLRVLDDAGQPVPFVLDTLETREATTRRDACPMSEPMARELENRGLELTFAIPPNGAVPCGLTVDTPLRDFRQQVRVEGGASSGAWQVLANGAMLYDLSRFVDVRQCDVSWAPSACHRFRITFFDVTRDRPDDLREITSGTAGTNTRQIVRTEPFRVRAVHFWREERVDGCATPVRVPCLLTADTAASQQEKGLFVFRSAREPLTRIVVKTPSRLFHRSYRLYGRNSPGEATPGEPGRLISSGMLTQIRFQEIDRTEMTIDFPVCRFREYALVCEAPAGDAAEITVDHAEGHCVRALFVATPGHRYSLAFGDASFYAPMPEAATIRTLLANGCRPIPATLGPGSGDTAPLPTWASWINSATAMIGAIVIAGLLLALLLVNALRKVK